MREIKRIRNAMMVSLLAMILVILLYHHPFGSHGEKDE